MSLIGEIIPIVLVVLVLCVAYIKGVKVFSVFTKGAKKGIESAISILPTLIGIVTAITMLSASGALEALAIALTPLCFGVPADIIPLAILRPISGSGSTSAVIDIFERFGVDSEIGNMASVLASSTETTFYAISVYFAGRNFKSLRQTVPSALLGDSIAIVLTVLTVRFFC